MANDEFLEYKTTFLQTEVIIQAIADYQYKGWEVIHIQPAAQQDLTQVNPYKVIGSEVSMWLVHLGRKDQSGRPQDRHNPGSEDSAGSSVDGVSPNVRVRGGDDSSSGVVPHGTGSYSKGGASPGHGSGTSGPDLNGKPGMETAEYTERGHKTRKYGVQGKGDFGVICVLCGEKAGSTTLLDVLPCDGGLPWQVNDAQEDTSQAISMRCLSR